MIKLLIEHGADVNPSNEFNKSTLVLALQTGKIISKTVDFLGQPIISQTMIEMARFALIRFRSICRTTHTKRS